MTDSQTPTPQMIYLPSDTSDAERLPMLQLWHALSGGQKPAQKPADLSPRVEVPLNRMGGELAGLRVTSAEVGGSDDVPYVILTLECGVTLYADDPVMYEPTPQV